MLRLQDAAVAIWGTMRVGVCGRSPRSATHAWSARLAEAGHGCPNRWVEATSPRCPWRC